MVYTSCQILWSNPAKEVLSTLPHNDSPNDSPHPKIDGLGYGNPPKFKVSYNFLRYVIPQILDLLESQSEE